MIFYFIILVTVDDDQTEGETASDKLRDLMIMGGSEESPIILPFSGFRERILAEKQAKAIDNVNPVPRVIVEKAKKSFENEPNMAYSDEERVGAHFRKYKTKAPPFTAEFITSNRFSPLDEEIRSNARKNYKQSFTEKHFPFEYENPGEIPEPRVYNDDDGIDEIPIDAGSGELDPYHIKGTLYRCFSLLRFVIKV